MNDRPGTAGREICAVQSCSCAAIVLMNGRSFMYTQAEMREVDTEIYKWSRACKNLPSRLKAVLAQTAHDYSIKDALYAVDCLSSISRVHRQRFY